MLGGLGLISILFIWQYLPSSCSLRDIEVENLDKMTNKHWAVQWERR